MSTKLKLYAEKDGAMTEVCRIVDAARQAGRHPSMARKIIQRCCSSIPGSPSGEPWYWAAEAICALEMTPPIGSGRPRNAPEVVGETIFVVYGGY
jgi:hypothetical protein